MTFRRSHAGLSNLHLFHRTDLVLYVEGGGKDVRLDAIAAGEGFEKTDDVVFWREIFRALGPKRKTAKVLSVGSKQTLLELAQEIIAGKVQNVVVGMDRDYDNHRAALLDHPHVLYTRAYSWESDVWCEDVVVAVLQAVVPSERDNPDVAAIVFQQYAQFWKDVRWATIANVLLAVHGRPLLLKNPAERFLRTSPITSPPRFAKGEARRVLAAQTRTKAEKLKQRLNVKSDLDCHGKLVGYFGYRLLCHLIRRFSAKVALPRVYAAGIAISKFIDLLSDGKMPQCVAHYRAQFSKLA